MREKSRINLYRAAAAVVLALLASCSLDYGEATMPEDLSEEVPDTVLYNFTHVSVENGRPSFQMSADQAETYGKRNETILIGTEFQEFNAEGEVVSEGRAAKARYFTDSEDAELSGGIYVYSKSQETEIQADTLSWKEEQRILSAGEGELVRIHQDTGSKLDGIGFRADMKTQEYTFSGLVDGTWADDEDE